MLSWGLSGLTKAINACLRSDEDTLSRLAQLQGKIIQITITDWHMHFFICPQADGINITRTVDVPPNAVIAGNSWNLLKAGCAKGQTSALFKNAIDVTGDTELGEAVRDVFTHIDIDWEEQLSNCIGDIAAHQLSRGTKRIRDMGKYTARTLSDNLREYLQQESQARPTRLLSQGKSTS